MTEYPEHDKLLAVKEVSQKIHEFLEYMSSTNGASLYSVAKTERGKPVKVWDDDGGEHILSLPFRGRITEYVAAFLGIDEQKLEKEKQAMLATLRMHNAGLKEVKNGKT